MPKLCDLLQISAEQLSKMQYEQLQQHLCARLAELRQLIEVGDLQAVSLTSGVGDMSLRRALQRLRELQVSSGATITWKHIPGFPRYQISSQGRVRRWCKRTHRFIYVKACGVTVSLYSYETRRVVNRSVNRLVSEVFGGQVSGALPTSDYS